VGNLQPASTIAVPLGATRRRWEWGQAIVLAGLLILLTLFILYPLLRVLVVAVVNRSSALYGAIGAVFGLLVFLRVAASLYLVGAELSALLAERRADP